MRVPSIPKLGVILAPHEGFQRHGGSWREALITLAAGFGVALALFGMGADIYVLLIVLASALVISIFYYPLFGVILAFVLSGTSQLTVVIPNVLSISKLVMIFTAVAYLMRKSLAKDLKVALKSKVLLSYGLPAIWFLFTIPFTSLLLRGADPGEIARRIFNILAILSLAFLISGMPKNTKQLSTTILGMVLGSVVIGVWIIFFAAGGGTAKLYAAVEDVTIYYDHNLGIQLALSVALSWILLMRSFWFIKILVLICNVILLVCVFLTQSRTSYASILVAISIIILRFLAKGRITSILKIGLIIFISGTSIIWFINSPFLPEYVKEVSFMRFESMFEPRANSSAAERLDVLWPASWAFVMENPVFGGGMAGDEKYGCAHNAVLEMGVEGGLIGICFYLISVFFMLRTAYRVRGRGVQIWGLAIAGLVIMASQTNPGTFYSIPYGFVMGFIAWIEINRSTSVSRSITPIT